MFRLGPRSRSRLAGVHPDLVVLVATAIRISGIDFGVLEGRRSLERQRELVARGASQTMNSHHLTGRAVDLGAWVGGRFRWDWSLYEQIADAMKTASAETGIVIEWGGDWTTFRDGPHFQLPRRAHDG